MQLTKHDGMLYLYNVAVVLTGAHAVWSIDFENRYLLFVIAAVFGAAWTVYFNWRMIERLADHPKLRADEDAAPAADGE